jgi:hypothetical protein
VRSVITIAISAQSPLPSASSLAVSFAGERFGSDVCEGASQEQGRSGDFVNLTSTTPRLEHKSHPVAPSFSNHCLFVVVAQPPQRIIPSTPVSKRKHERSREVRQIAKVPTQEAHQHKAAHSTNKARRWTTQLQRPSKRTVKLQATHRAHRRLALQRSSASGHMPVATPGPEGSWIRASEGARGQM